MYNGLNTQWKSNSALSVTNYSSCSWNIGRATVLQWLTHRSVLNRSRCVQNGRRRRSNLALGKSLNQAKRWLARSWGVLKIIPLMPSLTSSGKAGNPLAATGSPHPNMSTTYNKSRQVKSRLRRGYNPLIWVRGSPSHRVRPQYTGSKGNNLK